MNNIFMNSENRKTSDPHRLLLNISDKTNIKGSDKYVAVSIYDAWKNTKKPYKIIHLKYQLWHVIKSLN